VRPIGLTHSDMINLVLGAGVCISIIGHIGFKFNCVLCWYFPQHVFYSNISDVEMQDKMCKVDFNLLNIS